MGLGLHCPVEIKEMKIDREVGKKKGEGGK